MTTTDCYITMVGLESYESAANPEPFRRALPPPRPGHYWAPAVEAFASAHGIKITYPLDNLTPQIVIGGPELRLLLAGAYDPGHPFLAKSAPCLGQVYRYRVYAEDF